jgi:hypothetical protein
MPMFLLDVLLSFHKKLILPTFVVAIGIGAAGYFMIFSTPFLKGFGFGYILSGLITQYFVYDVRHTNEYFFYYNLGITKPVLYGSTLVLNFFIGIMILAI